MQQLRSAVRRVLHSRVSLVIVTGVAVAMLVHAFALASIPDGNSVIHACLGDGGSVRIIDDSLESCKDGEKELTWIHEVFAGVGLTGGGADNAPVDVDFHDVQSRVTGTCPAGSSAIRRITIDGTVECQPDTTNALVGTRLGGPIPNDDSIEGRLHLGAGRYVVTATLNVGTVRTPTPGIKFDIVICNMSTVGSHTSAVFRDYGHFTGGSLALTLPVRLSGPANVVLNCFDRGERPENNEMLYDSLTMTALSVETLRQVAM